MKRRTTLLAGLSAAWPLRADEAGCAQPASLGLELGLDRPSGAVPPAYVLGRDWINVEFAVHNAGPRPVGLVLAETGLPVATLVLRDARGRAWSVGAEHGETTAVRRWSGELRPGRVARRAVAFDPARLQLAPGPFQLSGRLGLAPSSGLPHGACGRDPESASLGFLLQPPGPADDEDIAWGEASQGCRIGLLAPHRQWRSGQPPLPFTLVFERGAAGAPRPLSIAGPSYYRLAVTGPGGLQFEVVQPAPVPASISPHFRHTALAPRQRCAQRLDWDPAGTALRRDAAFDSPRQAAGPGAPRSGHYRVRALYAVDRAAEARHAYADAGLELASGEIGIGIEIASATGPLAASSRPA